MSKALASSLAFSSQQAKWFPFSVNELLVEILSQQRPRDMLGMTTWHTELESAIHEWIVRRCFWDCPGDEATARCNAYRALGRGWFIVQLMVPQRKFKFWWEDIGTVESRRADELVALQKLLPGLDDISHFKHGYVIDNELVFYIRGIAHPQAPQLKAPSLQIMKWDPRFKLKSCWASNETLQQQLLAPAPSEGERKARVAAAERNRKKKENKKARKKQQAAAAAEAEVGDQSAKDENEAQQDFERLLSSMLEDPEMAKMRVE